MTDYLCTVTPLKCIRNCFFFILPFFRSFVRSFFFSSFFCRRLFAFVFAYARSYNDCIDWKCRRWLLLSLRRRFRKFQILGTYSSLIFLFFVCALFLYFRSFGVGFKIDFYVYDCIRKRQTEETKRRRNPLLFLFMHFFCLWTEKSQIFLRSQIFWLTECV